MGVDYTSYAIIGVRFDLPDMTKEIQQPSCEHPERIGHMFCPACGKMVGEYTVTDNQVAQDFIENLEETLEAPWEVVEGGEDYDQYFLGIVVTSSRDDYCDQLTRLPSYAEIKQKIQAILEPVGAWNFAQNNFGLHSVTIGR